MSIPSAGGGNHNTDQTYLPTYLLTQIFLDFLGFPCIPILRPNSQCPWGSSGPLVSSLVFYLSLIISHIYFIVHLFLISHLSSILSHLSSLISQFSSLVYSIIYSLHPPPSSLPPPPSSAIPTHFPYFPRHSHFSLFPRHSHLPLFHLSLASRSA